MPIYTHTTTLDSLHKILNSGKIKSVQHLAVETPDNTVDVEYKLGRRTRENMSAMDALNRMKNAGKNPDKIFLTREGHNSNYGDIIIAKQLTSPKEHFRFNLAPNEYTIKRPLSIKNNAVIYVPGKYLPDLKNNYKGLKFKPDKEFDYEITLKDRLNTLARKILNKEAEDVNLHALPKNKLRRLLGTNKAFYTGSSELGTSIGSSDTDIFIPYKDVRAFNRKVKQLKELYPHLPETKHSLKKPNKVTLSGIHNGQPVDLVIGHGDQAINYAKKFKEIKSTLSDSEKEKIKHKKEKLKNSWFLPEFRYKHYKKQVANDLGLKQFYF